MKAGESNQASVFLKISLVLFYLSVSACMYLYVDMHAKFPKDREIIGFPEMGVIGSCKLP